MANEKKGEDHNPIVFSIQPVRVANAKHVVLLKKGVKVWDL